LNESKDFIYSSGDFMKILLNYTKKINDKVANMPIIKKLDIDYKNLECTGWISSIIFKDELNHRFNPVTNIGIESKLEKLKKNINKKEETLYNYDLIQDYLAE